ncbi:MAG: aminomethyl-transferring glycine dehydrogenase subunit GcvPA [Magnetococcales bacterium]|nr:aminomethyl-transferring glycine dehydrogenase subunit GcvPA [Magnetococcales bacterium]MBF0438413.1 aminomethyl-transferring glycine dehydrogenase subunit GcvPA [Magnetococcales bacterium]
MPFIPHTSAEIDEMLNKIGVLSIETLFEEVPDRLHCPPLDLSPPLGEMAVSRLMRERADADAGGLCFIGAGAYEHHIPAAVWEIASRGEFLTAYTPYQAEASQGTLQVLYEFQTMMAGLTAMDASNASLYDGGSGLGEAVLMAVRANPDHNKVVLIPASVHPHYRQVVETMTQDQGIEIIEIPFDPVEGRVALKSLASFRGKKVAALVIPQPNFFGILEEVDELTDWAKAEGAVVIGLVNPLTLGLLKPPGEWGEEGADIACGDGQPLGSPLSSGGPYFGFLCCKQKLLRQMPGRIVGRTEDPSGRSGMILTLQAREQHIRRSRATSNICTSQGIMTVAAVIHLSLLGPEGLAKVAAMCHAKTVALVNKLTAIPGVSRQFTGPFFHEAALRLPKPTAAILAQLSRLGIQGGYRLGEAYAKLDKAILICATETKTEEDLDFYADTLVWALNVKESF